MQYVYGGACCRPTGHRVPTPCSGRSGLDLVISAMEIKWFPAEQYIITTTRADWYIPRLKTTRAKRLRLYFQNYYYYFR